MAFLIDLLAAFGGIVIAVAIFLVAWRLVTRARAGNRKVREARDDPHADPANASADDPESRRDIPQ
ncbi:MAG: hypothetical protein R3305_00175 [Gammaproteobacteria bacterium]|nr:hypothetical protein [Gammaproteobacteria bacterium]